MLPAEQHLNIHIKLFILSEAEKIQNLVIITSASIPLSDYGKRDEHFRSTLCSNHNYNFILICRSPVRLFGWNITEIKK